MALTKVKLISDGVIVQSNLHSSHGITTAHISEGSNLYYTDARVDTRVGNLNTGNLPEGSNLYYTNARADARIAAASTSDLSEGTNLYYTDARADARVALIVDSSPATLNTLNELAAALGDDPNFATTVTNSIATKLPLAGGTMTGDITISSTSPELKFVDTNSFTDTNDRWIVRGGADTLIMRWYDNSASSNTDVLTLSSTAATFAGAVTGAIARFDTLNNNANSANIIYRTGTNTIVGNNASALVVQDGGNVGIGTTSPGRGLTIDKSNANAALEIIKNNTTNQIVYLGTGSSGGTDDPLLRMFHNGTENIRLYTTGDSWINGGNVGIGTTSPANLLDIKSNGSSKGLDIHHSNGNMVAQLIHGGSGDEGQLKLYDSNIETVKIAGESGVNSFINSGNVGIGTTGPVNKLGIEVAANSNTKAINIYSKNTSPNSYTSIGSQYSISNTYVESEIRFGNETQSGGGSYLGFVAGGSSLGNTEKMRITSSGNVGIGETSPNSKLDVVGVNTSGVPLVELTASGTGPFQRGVRLLNGGMGAGSSIMYAVGYADNARNMGQTYFYYAGAGSTSNRISMGLHSVDDVFNILGTGNVGIGETSPDTKLHIKDSQDSSLYSGLKVERSANTTAAYLNAVGGALNLNTDSSMPLKFRIQNTSMQTINTNGGRAYAGFGGWRMFEYSYTVSVGNGATVDLFQNTSAHSDLHMVQIAIRMYHSGRTYWVGSGTVGGYGMNITGSGSGATNGGLTSASVSSGIRKLQISQSSGYTAQATIYIQFRLDDGSGINVLNGTLSSL